MTYGEERLMIQMKQRRISKLSNTTPYVFQRLITLTFLFNPILTPTPTLPRPSPISLPTPFFFQVTRTRTKLDLKLKRNITNWRQIKRTKKNKKYFLTLKSITNSLLACALIKATYTKYDLNPGHPYLPYYLHLGPNQKLFGIKSYSEKSTLQAKNLQIILSVSLFCEYTRDNPALVTIYQIEILTNRSNTLQSTNFHLFDTK